MTYFIKFILTISFVFVFIQCNKGNKTSNNTKISNIKKDSTKLRNEYIITYSNNEKEKLNLISFNSNVIFDSLKIVKKESKILMLKKMRKANYVLSNQNIKKYIKKNYKSIFYLMENKIYTNYSFIIDEKEFSLPVIDRVENYYPKKDSVFVCCDLYITRIYFNGEKFNIIPIVSQIRETK